MLLNANSGNWQNVVQHAEKSQRANRHIWFLPTHKPKRKKPKEPIFCPRSDRPTRKRTKSILKNEINGNFGLF
jgi:hypothetical protein